MTALAIQTDKFVYFGNLAVHSHQYKTGKFIGLALRPSGPHEIGHDARNPLPFDDESVNGFQSQDVFEHVEYEKIPALFDEVFRCLRRGAPFRLSVPDYNSPLLTRRSVYNADGQILCDISMGGSVKSSLSGPVEVVFARGGGAHLWFPTYASLLHAILSSKIRTSSEIKFYQYWRDRVTYVCEPFDNSVMLVKRTPPRDMRADGKPISIIVDFIK